MDGAVSGSLPGSENKRAGSVRSVDRAFEMLELLAAADAEVPLSRLSADAGLPVPTTHRLVRSLVAGGYVLQLPSRAYTLGPRMIGLGTRASRAVEAWADPHLRALADTTGESANLAILDTDHVVYVAQAASTRHTVRMFTEVGRRVPVHCTGVGKAVLSRLPEEAARALLSSAGMPARTEHTFTDLDAMAVELRTTAERGYAVDDGEQELGVRCVAVPVPGHLRSAVSVSGPASRVTREAVPELARVLVEAAAALASPGSSPGSSAGATPGSGAGA